MPFYPTGNAGAIFINGSDTTIRDCIFNSNIAENKGAAIYIEGHNTTIEGTEFYDHSSTNGTVYLIGDDCEIRNSYFHNNDAQSSGACIYIEGNNAEISNTTFINNTASDGGCIYVIGDHTTIDNDTTFVSNTATNGAGVYVNGSNTAILNSSFYNNTAENGAGAFIYGHDSDVNASRFEGNNATNGGGLYIEGDISILNNNTFFKNNVTNQGGAVYIDGSHTNVTNNNFTRNEAVPKKEDQETGLGGAIFVHGTSTNTLNNSFYHNKARNGSAIYTDGTDFNLTNDVFYENQAWSYVLVVTAVPPESLYQSSDIDIDVTHIGGDNIINAIHNHGTINDIYFKNVTYINSHGDEMHSDEFNFVHPKDGAEQSEGGTLIYQDDREDYQLLQLKVTHEDGEVFYYNTTMYTNIYGNVNITLPRNSLRKGLYIVDAEHIEDWNYKFIVNATLSEFLMLWMYPSTRTAMKTSISKTTLQNGKLLFKIQITVLMQKMLLSTISCQMYLN
jgi:predicted outer membrane repeat protein